MADHIFACPIPATDATVGVNFSKLPENVTRYLLEYAATVIATRACARTKEEGPMPIPDRIAAMQARVAGWYDGKPTIGGGRASDPVSAEAWRLAYDAAKPHGVNREKGEELPAFAARVVRAALGDRKVKDGKVAELASATVAKWRATAESIVASRKADSGLVLDI